MNNRGQYVRRMVVIGQFKWTSQAVFTVHKFMFGLVEQIEVSGPRDEVIDPMIKELVAKVPGLVGGAIQTESIELWFAADANPLVASLAVGRALAPYMGEPSNTPSVLERFGNIEEV